MNQLITRQTGVMSDPALAQALLEKLTSLKLLIFNMLNISPFKELDINFVIVWSKRRIDMVVSGKDNNTLALT